MVLSLWSNAIESIITVLDPSTSLRMNKSKEMLRAGTGRNDEVCHPARVAGSVFSGYNRSRHGGWDDIVKRIVSRIFKGGIAAIYPPNTYPLIPKT